MSTTERVELDRQRKLADWRRRRLVAGACIFLGVLVAFVHIVEHLGAFTLYRSGVDDLVAGYPLALLLVIVGAMRLPPRV